MEQEKQRDIAIGSRIRRTRKWRGMDSAAGFATLLQSRGLAIGQSQLRAMETGEKRITPERLAKIADALGVSTTYLQTGNDSPCFDRGASKIKNPCGSPVVRERAARAYDQAYSHAGHAHAALQAKEISTSVDVGDGEIIGLCEKDPERIRYYEKDWADCGHNSPTASDLNDDVFTPRQLAAAIAITAVLIVLVLVIRGV